MDGVPGEVFGKGIWQKIRKERRDGGDKEEDLGNVF